jgi:NAD(P)-dependent dehydrogenase (short-subunit alcohol dehydrogenase family)
MKRLENKVAIITGSGRGIGRETALLFAQEGAKVVVSDIDSAAGEQTATEIRRAGGTAIFVPRRCLQESRCPSPCRHGRSRVRTH